MFNIRGRGSQTFNEPRCGASKAMRASSEAPFLSFVIRAACWFVHMESPTRKTSLGHNFAQVLASSGPEPEVEPESQPKEERVATVSACSELEIMEASAYFVCV